MAVISNNFSKLIYTSPKKFNKLIQEGKNVEVGRERIYSLAHAKTTDNPTYSLYSNTCSIFKVNNTCGHIAPDYSGFNLRNFLEKLTEKIKKEKDKNDIVSGFVLGGKNNDSMSSMLAYGIGNTFEKEGVDFSMIILKNENSPKALDSMFHKGNTIYFTQEYNSQLEKDIAAKVKNNPNPSQEELEKILSKYWDYLEFSPNHKLDVRL